MPLSQMTLPELELKELPDDIRELFTRAREYQQLQATPGFRRLLDFMGRAVDVQLAAVRASRSDDDHVNARLTLRWKAGHSHGRRPTAKPTARSKTGTTTFGMR